MARIRSIHPGMASDESFMSMSMGAKAAWPLLWTECDDHGVFEWKPIVLKARIFPADNVDFAAILSEYESLDCIRRVEIKGKSYGFIRNFCRYQRPKYPSYRHPFPEEQAAYVSFGVKPTGTQGEDSPCAIEKGSQMKREKEEEVVEESKDKKDHPQRASAPDTKPDRRKGTRLDPKWVPNAEDLSFSRSLGIRESEIDRIASLFRDYWIAKSGQQGSKLDWSATWRNWCRREAERLGRKPIAAPNTTTVIDWEQEVLKFKGGSRWLYREFGPEPGYGGCKVPKPILEKYGYTEPDLPLSVEERA